MPPWHWRLVCSECPATAAPDGLPTICPTCGSPWLVEYDRLPPHPGRTHGANHGGAIPSAKLSLAGDSAGREWSMWRYREWLPLRTGEDPVTLGEGMTPLLRVPDLERRFGVGEVWIKDESKNPTGSFKARGLAVAVTRAVFGGATAFTVPTAGNAGVALSAYARRAGLPARVYAPRTTPRTLLAQIRTFGATLELVDGHIGDCGKRSRADAATTGAFDVSTLREPYRIEGKKTLGLELAEQLEWSLPDVIIYPAGGGTGLIGMWKAFRELARTGWVPDRLPRFFAVQSAGCAPVVRAFEQGATRTEAWPDPETVASGLRVPAPLGGALMLRALRDSGGGAVAVSEAALCAAQQMLAITFGVDAAPEGGAAVAALEELARRGEVGSSDRVVVFNTGAGWLYR
ncbi:MAG TPA: threonine synthase [Gemmatimonadales bacterium]|nr:threonine synthase [Gemmatimonadales bacterium]